MGFWNLCIKDSLFGARLCASWSKSHFITKARSKNTIETKIKFVLPIWVTSKLTIDAPTILPRLAPAEIMPKSRLLESLLNTSQANSTH